MPNIKNKIDSHNKTLMHSKETENNETKKTCNCRKKEECPLEQKCLQSNVVYQAKITRLDNQHTESYVGLCETDFKTRFRNHKTSINNNSKRNTTELSKYI